MKGYHILQPYVEITENSCYHSSLIMRPYAHIITTRIFYFAFTLFESVAEVTYLLTTEKTSELFAE